MGWHRAAHLIVGLPPRRVETAGKAERGEGRVDARLVRLVVAGPMAPSAVDGSENRKWPLHRTRNRRPPSRTWT